MTDLIPKRLRQQVLRRVRYATSVLSLQEDRVPPEGPFDVALTNGLLAIVAEEWPDEIFDPKRRNFFRAARDLLTVITNHGGLPGILDEDLLREGLNLTQPARHGRADDEFVAIGARHVEALAMLDGHHALCFLNQARGRSLSDCFVLAYRERADQELGWLSPKDRLETPGPEDCDQCGRGTFFPIGWDDFGGTNSPGTCLACGYERDAEDAYWMAVSEHLDWLD